MSVLPSIHDTDHPFNVWQKYAAPVAVVVLLGVIVFFQYFLGDLRGSTLDAALQEQRAEESAEEPGVGGLVVESKHLVKYVRGGGVAPAVEAGGQRTLPDEEIKAEIDESIQGLDAAAVSRVERLRVAVVVGELRGAGAALERLEPLKREAAAEGDLAKDLYWLIEHYKAAEAEKPTRPDEAVRASLISRHGWFAELAFAFALGDEDPQRAGVIGGFRNLAAIGLIVMVFSLLAFIVGIVLLVIMLRKAHEGEFEVEIYETGVPGRLYLEMFGVFLTGFTVLLLVEVLVTGQTQTWAVVIGDVLMWACAGAVLWPLLRGVDWEGLRTDLGWTRGQGVLREMVAGGAGFLISIPLTLLVGLVAGLLEHALREGGDGAGSVGGVPMFRQPLSESWVPVVLGAVSAIVWAPLVEESLFRGALHRWLPSWLRIGGRVAVSAIVFGIVHPYSPSGMAQVAAGGVVFGLLREWRGSLVAPMTAHALHNGAIELITISTLAALG